MTQTDFDQTDFEFVRGIIEKLDLDEKEFNELVVEAQCRFLFEPGAEMVKSMDVIKLKESDIKLRIDDEIWEWDEKIGNYAFSHKIGDQHE